MFVSDNSAFRFTYAVWRDEDKGIQGRYRVSQRFWTTSDDDGHMDQYLPLNKATASKVKESLDWAGDRLLDLSTRGKFREDYIKLPL